VCVCVCVMNVLLARTYILSFDVFLKYISDLGCTVIN
jgi:hypothetical protein